MAQIGDKGAELDLLIRQGATFGPITITLSNPDNSPVSLVGSTIRVGIRKTPNSRDIEGFVVENTITNAIGGVFTMKISDESTTLLSADSESEFSPASTYLWNLDIEDSLGNSKPFFYGKVNVVRGV
jgi:hypothetical protein